MNYNLETWKGSCGYAAQGRVGIQGQNGNSIHFSSIDTSINDTSTLIKERILHNQSLTNNTEAITEEKYQVNDYILDVYGQLCVITAIEANSVNRSRIGNIAFTDKKSGYSVPVDSSTNKSELSFKLKNDLSYPPYTGDISSDYHENAFILRNSQHSLPSEDGRLWKLWRYRYYGHITYYNGTVNGTTNIPRGYMCVPNDSSYPLTWKTDNGDTSTFQTTKEFVEYVIDNEEYCKICAVLNNGLVIESIPTRDSIIGIFIEKGYIESIDKNLTTLTPYTRFIDELDASLNDSSIKNTIKSGQPISMCNMYFEYSHNGELYRMNINVT